MEKNGKLFDEPTQKVWRSGLIDLGHPDRRKLVRDAFIDTAYDALLTVRTESGEKRALVRGGKGVQRVRINLTGSKIGLEIRCRQAKASVARPAIRYALVR